MYAIAVMQLGALVHYTAFSSIELSNGLNLRTFVALRSICIA
jgi:hypothetical protein